MHLVNDPILNVQGKNDHQNISLSGIEYDDVIPSGTGICMGDTTYNYIAHNVTVKISNLGDSPIDHIILIPDRQFFIIYCWHTPLYRSDFNELNIDPGETAELFIGDVQIELDENESLSEFCLSAILPDNHTDIDKENNRFCVEKIVQSNTPSKDNLLSFFPNPASNIIYLESLSEEILTTVVFDMQGRLIFSEVITPENPILNIDGIKPGMYFLRCTTTKGVVKIGKFIKL